MHSQTWRLLEALFSNPAFRNGITRDLAWRLLGIQNLTARLADLRNMGFHFEKTTSEWLSAPHVQVRRLKITTWKLNFQKMPHWVSRGIFPG